MGISLQQSEDSKTRFRDRNHESAICRCHRVAGAYSNPLDTRSAEVFPPCLRNLNPLGLQPLSKPSQEQIAWQPKQPSRNSSIRSKLPNNSSIVRPTTSI